MVRTGIFVGCSRSKRPRPCKSRFWLPSCPQRMIRAHIRIRHVERECLLFFWGSKSKEINCLWDSISGLQLTSDHGPGPFLLKKYSNKKHEQPKRLVRNQLLTPNDRATERLTERPSDWPSERQQEKPSLTSISMTTRHWQQTTRSCSVHRKLFPRLTHTTKQGFLKTRCIVRLLICCGKLPYAFWINIGGILI